MKETKKKEEFSYEEFEKEANATTSHLLTIKEVCVGNLVTN